MGSGITRAAVICALYAGWMAAFHLLALTVMTYVLMSQNPKFQDINDLYASNEILLVSSASVLFVVLLRMLYPILTSTNERLISRAIITQRFLPGFAQGAILAVLLAGCFMLSGTYRYLGFFVQAEDNALAGVAVLLRIAALTALVFCEEFIVRQKILGALRKDFKTALAILIAALIGCAFKAIQFDLGMRQLFTLLLLGLLLGVRAVIAGDSVRGSGFLAGLLVLSHPILSLSVFGSDFQGAFLLRFDPDFSGTQVHSEASVSLAQWVTGGYGGPLSSIALQIVLIAELTRLVWNHRRIFITQRITSF